MSLDKALKAQVIKQIIKCLYDNSQGRSGLPTLQKSTSQVSKTTFYRWVNECLKNPPKKVVKQTEAEILKLAQRRSPRTSAKTAKKKLQKVFPITLCPETIASVGIDTLDFMFEMERLYSDVYLIRNRAVKINESGEEKVLNPKLLIDSIRARKGLLDTLINAQHLLMDMNRLARTHNMILDTVAQEAPRHSIK